MSLPLLPDPFAPEADPYPEEPRLSRRALTALLVAAPAATWLTGCVGPRRACLPPKEERRSCEHRFCRYYLAPEGEDPGRR